MVSLQLAGAREAAEALGLRGSCRAMPATLLPQAPPQENAVSTLALCALFTLRLEAPFLLPWVAYHQLAGVDQVLLYHDDVSGSWAPSLAEKHADLLSELRQRPGVTLFSMSALNLRAQPEQVEHCQAYLQEHNPTPGATWAGNWDIDEVAALGRPPADKAAEGADGCKAASTGTDGQSPEFDLKGMLRTLPPDAVGLYVPRFTFGATAGDELPAENATEWEQWRVRLNWHTKGKVMWRVGAKVHTSHAGHNFNFPKARRLYFPDASPFEPPPTRNASDYTAIIQRLEPSEHEGASLPAAVIPLRLHHYERRSVAECNRKRVMFDAVSGAYVSHGSGGEKTDRYDVDCAAPMRMDPMPLITYSEPDCTVAQHADAVGAALGEEGRRVVAGERHYFRKHLQRFMDGAEPWDFDAKSSESHMIDDGPAMLSSQ